MASEYDGCWCFFFFSSRRRHTRWTGDWSSDVCSSDLLAPLQPGQRGPHRTGCAAGRLAGGPRRLGWSRGERVGRGSCRGRGESSGGAGSLKKKKEETREERPAKTGAKERSREGDGRDE